MYIYVQLKHHNPSFDSPYPHSRGIFAQQLSSESPHALGPRGGKEQGLALPPGTGAMADVQWQFYGPTMGKPWENGGLKIFNGNFMALERKLMGKP